MASIRERVSADGKKSYHVQVRVRTFPPQTKSFDRLAAAKQWASLVETELRSGRYLPRVEAARHTVQDLIDKYRTEVLIPHKPKQVKDQGHHLDWWAQKLGRYSLSDLSADRIGKCCRELADEIRPNGEKRAASTVVRYMGVLSHALNTAVKEWGWLDKSPMSSVRKPKVDNSRARFLSDDERERLLNSARDSKYKALHTIVLLALSTGMRYSEIMTLRWRDIVLESQEGLSLVVLDKTKNGQKRGIPLMGDALEEIRSLKLAASKGKTESAIASKLLFPSHRKPMQPMLIRKVWLECMADAGIKEFRFHDLRHSAASYLAMSGASLRDIAEILGHKDLQMVNRYAHLTKTHLAGVLGRMNAKLKPPIPE
jgi:integrase